MSDSSAAARSLRESPETRRACHLCGLRVGPSGLRTTTQGRTLDFCCAGCLYVFQVLFSRPEGPPGDYRDTDLYRACVASGIIARGEPESVREESEQESRLLELSQDLTFTAGGMWCPACALLIQEVLRARDGVIQASASFLTDLVRVRYLPHLVSPQGILGEVSKLGYRASLFGDAQGYLREKRDLLLRLGVSSILTMNIMMISFALYFGFFQDLGEGVVSLLSYPLWLMATPVVFYGGFPILQRACAGLRHGIASMDTLISVGSLSAYGYSLFQMSKGSLHVYFDTAAMLITLVLIGRSIENHARERVTRGIHELYGLARQKVRLLREGVERWVASEAVEAGDTFGARKGERVSVDGIILNGQARLDESFLTGEPRPVKKSEGDTVLAGSLILEGDLLLRAASHGAQSSISRMMALLQEALDRKNPAENLADRISPRLVSAVLALAGGTALVLGLTGSPGEESLLRALTVLVITCPCALGIAAPLAKVASLEAGRRKGILIADPAALEKIAGLDVLVLDKTGTVTEGRFAIRHLLPAPGVSEESALSLAAAVEAHADHFLAKQIMEKARERSLARKACFHFRSEESRGVSGVVEGKKVILGNREFLRRQVVPQDQMLERVARDLESKGETVVFQAWDGKVRALIGFGDEPKGNARDLVSILQARGMKIRLVSGDSRATTAAVAAALNIGEFAGQALPAEKMEIVRRLQEDGLRVGMVGDGSNDAPALAQADVGFALGSGSSLLQTGCDVTLLSTNLTKLLDAFDLAALSTRVIRQNLFFSFLYNLLGVPLAVSGLLNPIVAVLAMFASSLTVVVNTLRIR
ncbi:MAG: heavy metal translocating P-type ATPase [Thermodesulfobacteriota bacterium]